MILITSTFGATNAYPDHDMMVKTLKAFLNSLDRQTNKNFRLFLACHDKVVGIDYPWMEWCSMMVDVECKQTRYWAKFPASIKDEGVVEIGSYGSKMSDMSRKTYHGMIRAGRWAWQNGLKEFWILRMDSDDLLARDTVETLEKLDKESYIEAVYNRKCHMFDVHTREVGEHRYPYSTTCNAIKMRFDGEKLPRWYYHCTDHTLFMRHVSKDGIPHLELDWTLCIVTNSGNHISSRPTLKQHQHTYPIELTKDISERYGLESLSRS